MNNDLRFVSYKRILCFVLLIGMPVIFVTGCGLLKEDIEEVTDSIDAAVEVLDDAIDKLGRESSDWRSVLEEALEELPDEVQDTMRVEVNGVLENAISDIGIETRCTFDYFRTRVREDLIRIRAKYTNEQINLVPKFCNPTPSEIEYELAREGRPPNIKISGYNLDKSNIIVLLEDNQGNETDVTFALDNPGGQYLITVNLGGNGVPLTPSSRRLKFLSSDNEIASVGVIQPVLPAIDVEFFTETSTVASNPKVEVEVPNGYKIIGGGARVNWTGVGNLLTATYPLDSRTWAAESKDHSISDPASITVWAIAIHDPEDQWDVQIFQETSNQASHPVANVSIADDYILVGGGARINWTGAGNLLTASYPLDSRTWEARGKDHEVTSPATITAYAIGIRPNGHDVYPTVEIFESESLRDQIIKYSLDVDGDYILIGGGAIVNWQGGGNLLTGSYPNVNGTTWFAESKDHNVISPATLKIYAIGIKR